jgi:sugar/nucleoside kinase (ribokinase family)
MTRRGVLTGGTWCIDRNKLLDQWPDENGRADILEAETNGGGSACNMAIDLKKLDPSLPVATIGLVGDDPDGRFLIAQADEYGIDRTQMAVTDQAQTDYTDAYSSRATGRRTHISYFGTSHLLTPDHFDFSRTSHRLFHLGLPGIHRIMDAPWKGDANGWVATLKAARAVGLRTNLELASIAPERLAQIVGPCLPHLDLLVVNDAEIAGIAGVETVIDGEADAAACVAAAKAALAMGAMELVAVHFPMGAVVASRDGSVAMSPSVNVPASEVKGANGAGDAFAAGFLYAFHEGWSIPKALSLAHATAAVSLRQVTTTGSVESWSKCLELANDWGWREELAAPAVPLPEPARQIRSC